MTVQRVSATSIAIKIRISVLYIEGIDVFRNEWVGAIGM